MISVFILVVVPVADVYCIIDIIDGCVVDDLVIFSADGVELDVSVHLEVGAVE